MPVHFNNGPFDGNFCSKYDSSFAIGIRQKSDIEAIAQFVPEQFEVIDDHIRWDYCDCHGIDYMAGGEYRILQCVAFVRYTTKDGQQLDGDYPLVIFEDRFEPIRGGREDCGMPKLLCDISTNRHVGNHWFAFSSMYSYPMIQMNFFEEGKVPDEIVKANTKKGFGNVFGVRCIPNIGKGGTAVNQTVLYPQKSDGDKDVWVGTGEVKLFVPEEKYWYTSPYYGIMSKLASLPNYGFDSAIRSLGQLDLFCNGCQVLEEK